MQYNKHKQRSHKTRKERMRAAVRFLNEQPPLCDLRSLHYGLGGYW